MESVQTFGRKKTAVAVAYCKKGRGLIKINGCPIELVEPEMLRYKVFEPILLLGRERFANVDIRLRVKGGGYTSQIYAIRQVRTRLGFGLSDLARLAPTLVWELIPRGVERVSFRGLPMHHPQHTLAPSLLPAARAHHPVSRNTRPLRTDPWSRTCSPPHPPLTRRRRCTFIQRQRPSSCSPMHTPHTPMART